MKTVYTIGHSTRSIEDFIEILAEYRIRTLADIRIIPRSSRNPQFNNDQLSLSLSESGITYQPFKELGGLRKPRKDSDNLGWRNESFRGYADYMQTNEFEAGLRRLVALMGINDAVIMCAEAVPWRCHRSLVGDALIVNKFEVIDIFNKRNSKPHILTSWAKIDGTRITYPRLDDQLFLQD